MLVFAYLGPSDLGAAALTCSDWCSLVLTGRQLGALPDTPPRSAAWLAHAAALGARLRAAAALSTRTVRAASSARRRRHPRRPLPGSPGGQPGVARAAAAILAGRWQQREEAAVSGP